MLKKRRQTINHGSIANRNRRMRKLNKSRISSRRQLNLFFINKNED